ncbi:MAG: hypothetical protein KDA58_09185, partial [Planctomycetaceae bacterium]|nr:hypothetical protein [Planctomycetaceae bacterium]
MRKSRSDPIMQLIAENGQLPESDAAVLVYDRLMSLRYDDSFSELSDAVANACRVIYLNAAVMGDGVEG